MRNRTASLNTLDTGMSGVVDQIEGDSAFAKRLAGHGVIKGARLEVTARAPFGGLMKIEVMGGVLSLRSSDASKIIVKLEKS